jgi:hypothetical protein
MSKPSRQKKPPHKKVQPHDTHITARPQLQKQRRIFALVVIVVLAGIPFSLSKYFEFNSPGPFDSGAYVYSAAHILSGAKIGVEEKPSARLGTLLANMLGVWLFGFNETGPKLIQLVLQAAALVLMFVTMRKLFGLLAAAVGVIIASVYLSAPLIAKFGNVKEQYMIACMVIGISCFILYQLDNKWWQAMLAGAFLIWAPLFKPTGISAIGAVGLFVVLQPLLKNKTLKQTGFDIALLLAGAIAALAPLYIWILAWNVQLKLPYTFVWQTLTKFAPAKLATDQAKTVPDYISRSRKMVPFSEQWPIVLRYHGKLILPISLAVCAIAVRIVRGALRKRKAGKIKPVLYDRFVLLLAVWWLLDMAFVWISPRSYEQYYLPLNASAAMLAGYPAALYRDRLAQAAEKTRWIVIGVVGVLLMIVLSWHIFFGITNSPYNGRSYGQRRRGYAQKLKEISQRRKQNRKASWEIVGEYIRENSEPTDKIYVWGWIPGIYVQAQRFSSASRAFSMTRQPPQVLIHNTITLLNEFKQTMPKFIVDTRKRHIPTERPPYELWPIAPKGFMGLQKSTFLPVNERVIETYDRQWEQMLRERFGDDEADRYEALKPLREFVMKNYQVVSMFGQHVLFELKPSTRPTQ